MADVRNCRRCGKIFNYLGGMVLCNPCRQLEEDDFKRVKEYLYNNPKASLSQVSVELDVSVEKIKRYLREGRLEIVGNEGGLLLECESCGSPIKSGQFCNACRATLSGELKREAAKIDKSISRNEFSKQSSGLRYLYKDDKKK